MCASDHFSNNVLMLVEFEFEFKKTLQSLESDRDIYTTHDTIQYSDTRAISSS